MRFHLKKQDELDKAAEYLSELARTESTVDIKRVAYKRSISQNSYYHLMLSFFGAQVGHTVDEVKTLIRRLQPELYQLKGVDIAGVQIPTSRSSADFSSAEMTKSIDDFRKWSREVADIEIPAPDDIELLKYVDDTIAANEQYL